MRLTKERKILAAILGVGVAGLFLDRVVLDSGLTGAESASAVLVERAAADLSAPPALLVDESDPPSPGPTLADRLEEAAATAESAPSDNVDAFHLPDTWFGTPAQAPEPEARHAAAMEFARTHRVEAVVTSDQMHCAIVNGKAVRVGQRLDGFTLVSVDQRSAVFEAKGIRTRLTIETEGLVP